MGQMQRRSWQMLDSVYIYIKQNLYNRIQAIFSARKKSKSKRLFFEPKIKYG